MKKFLVIMLCVVLLGATPIIASAEGDSVDAVEENTTVTENLPTEEETATEGENSASETDSEKPITEVIVDYVKSQYEEILVLLSILGATVYKKVKDGKFSETLGTLNNNSIKIYNKGVEVAEAATEKMNEATAKLEALEERFDSLMAKYEKSEEEKMALASMLSHVETFLKTAKCATLELSNEVAELLVLANIPNSKKDELYARHTKAVHELEVVEEVMSNDGTEV